MMVGRALGMESNVWPWVTVVVGAVAMVGTAEPASSRPVWFSLTLTVTIAETMNKKAPYGTSRRTGLKSGLSPCCFDVMRQVKAAWIVLSTAKNAHTHCVERNCRGGAR